MSFIDAITAVFTTWPWLAEVLFIGIALIPFLGIVRCLCKIILYKDPPSCKKGTVKKRSVYNPLEFRGGLFR